MVTSVEIDKEACIGCGACAATAPDVFDMNDENIAILKGGSQVEDEGTAMSAAQGCPVNAIHVTVDDKQKI